MTTKHSVKDDGDLRRYYAAIPNLIFTLGLSPHELALYVYLKKVAGEGGTCWKSTRTIAKETGMGAGTVSRTKVLLARERPELNSKPLIVMNIEEQNGSHAITVTDIWPENMAELERVRRVKTVRSTGERLASQSDTPRSTGDGVRSSVERVRSSVEPKNNPLRKTHEEQSAHADLMTFHADRIEGAIPDGGKQGKAIKWILANGFSVEDAKACYEWIAEWADAPSWALVKGHIGAWAAKRRGNGRAAVPERIPTLREKLAAEGRIQ